MNLVLWKTNGKVWNISIQELIEHHQLITIACVLHNCCEMWGAPEPKFANAKIRGDNLIGFGVDKSFTIKEGKQTKTKVEILKRVF